MGDYLRGYLGGYWEIKLQLTTHLKCLQEVKPVHHVHYDASMCAPLHVVNPEMRGAYIDPHVL